MIKKEVEIFAGIVMLLIIFIIIVFNWEDFKINLLSSSGNEIAQEQKICKTQCEELNKTAFCCNIKSINHSAYNCQQDILKTSCELDCTGVCETYCSTIGYMLPCAKAGCSWVLNKGGFCKAKKWV